ncbi:class I SAM-dependent methyltransferase [Haloechinothrix sp. YIM 98757]|uniref:Class I SAM-dependent methyltransferase n=2 Tax=Haloechinothrix aidingensis TaxID=2752311 RepID=A0A838A7B2_9PSEU|nr:class I SAM-dependent methyltransferase [Haloechinothrix aidingensis]
MMLFSDFDARGYRTVDVRSGYGEWVRTYERSVEDVMDIGLLELLTEPSWERARRVADLGCGTGRTGAWLRERGAAAVDGVDLTPEMLDRARLRGAHDYLGEADVRDTGLAGGAYDLVVASLVDEHLADLAPLYGEAWRLAVSGGAFVLVGYHPHFIMHAGMPTHYTPPDGEPTAISTTVHLISDHVTAALEAGWRLAEMREGVIDEQWLAVKPQWKRFRNHPISVATVWRKP